GDHLPAGPAPARGGGRDPHRADGRPRPHRLGRAERPVGRPRPGLDGAAGHLQRRRVGRGGAPTGRAALRRRRPDDPAGRPGPRQVVSRCPGRARPGRPDPAPKPVAAATGDRRGLPDRPLRRTSGLLQAGGGRRGGDRGGDQL
ncbi:MAG: hypothetical protein AVDCRST_MAG76-1600, partial [uncultured Acidimicrobiales bacterium]